MGHVPVAWRDLVATAAVTGVLVGAYLVVPHPVVQYGAWLVVFAVWMAWFVLAGVEWLSNPDG
ncbi:hypothetical protein [Halorientalis litorea]|jgi:hypothetical protein|uniref:hypothetical protein n=1 Tax=Halorientalis litorea TaxID=2931977 RepID=UPI001FF57960|nr:hypothetical protein [Halorientalis litorea]